MSYREIRNVTDLLRRMGYARLISLESFRLPNFLLVADILRWFLKRYDPSVEVSDDLDTEAQRVTFIRAFVQHMLRKTGLKLNSKRLYQSDGYAVKEITKVIQFFSKATQEANASTTQREAGQHQGPKDLMTQFYEFQPSLHKVRATRDLSTFLTEKGVAFFDLITKEISNRTARESVLSKPFDLKDYERILRKSIAGIKTEEVKLKSALDSSDGTINSLNMKIEKKRQELERSEQRLETMTKVRPAYMDEFEKLQRELEVLYHDYVTRFRILCHLQHQMDEMGTTEGGQGKLQNGSMSREESFRNRPRTAPGGGDEFSGSDIEDEEDEESLDESLHQNARDLLVSRGGKSGVLQVTGRPQGTAKTGRGDNELVIPNRARSSRKSALGGTRVNMYGALDDEEEESESDLLLLEGDNSDLGSEIDEEAELVMSMRGGANGKPDHMPLRPGLRNGNAFMESARSQRPTPPAPTGSRNNLDEQLAHQAELESYSRTVLASSAKGKSNGTEQHRRAEINDDGDSLTKPLRPDPRYASNGPIGPDMTGSGTLSGRPSTKHRGKRVSSGNGTGLVVSRDRPPTRPASRVTQLLDNVNEDDL